MRRQLTALLCALCLTMLTSVATAGDASFDLQVTEIWPGNEPGANLTRDWFEITNEGTVEWSTADGSLYYDDSSADFLDAVPITGVSSIAPGESVIVLNIDGDPEAEAVQTFEDVWGSVAILPTIAITDGAGLGQSGDAVTLFLSNGPPTGPENIIELASYPDANSDGGQSYDVSLGEFSTVGNASGAVQSAIANDVQQFAIGSPGPAVPEPGTISLMLLGAVLGILRYRWT